jgi:hypothetical protein
MIGSFSHKKQKNNIKKNIIAWYFDELYLKKKQIVKQEHESVSWKVTLVILSRLISPSYSKLVSYQRSHSWSDYIWFKNKKVSCSFYHLYL